MHGNKMANSSLAGGNDQGTLLPLVEDSLPGDFSTDVNHHPGSDDTGAGDLAGGFEW